MSMDNQIGSVSGCALLGRKVRLPVMYYRRFSGVSVVLGQASLPYLQGYASPSSCRRQPLHICPLAALRSSPR